MRLCIAGGPKTGASALGAETAVREKILLRSTEQLEHGDFRARGEDASWWFDEPGPWVVAGVSAAHALRAWLQRNPAGMPCDRVIFLTDVGELTPGEARVRGAVHTVFKEIVPELERRGIKVEGSADVPPPKVVTARWTETDAEVADQVEDGESPLARYLASPSGENAALLAEVARAGKLTLNDVEAALAQEVITMTTLLANAEGYDEKKLNELRMVRVQVQRVLKELGKVVKKVERGADDYELHVLWPGEYAADPGDMTPTEYSHLPPATQKRDGATDDFGDEDELVAGDDELDA